MLLSLLQVRTHVLCIPGVTWRPIHCRVAKQPSNSSCNRLVNVDCVSSNVRPELRTQTTAHRLPAARSSATAQLCPTRRAREIAPPDQFPQPSQPNRTKSHLKLFFPDWKMFHRAYA